MRRVGFFGSGDTTGYTPVVTPITVSSVWAGGVTDTTATVKARSTASAATLRYSTDPGLAGASSVAGTEGSDDVFAFALTGLSPETRYYYGFAGSSVTGTFRTFPVEGDIFSFLLATASCAGEVGGDYEVGTVANTPAFDRIVDQDPYLFIHTGDRGYPDITTNSPASFRTNYNANMAMSKQLALHQAMAVDYVWDDHDFGNNNSDGTSASKPAAQSVYREHVPHWTLPHADMIYHSYAIGRVRFIIIDPRSARTPQTDPDNSSKTILGATQKTWLKAELLAATEPVIMLMTGSPWIGTTSNPTWGLYSTERAEMAEFFEDNNLTDRLFLFSGDQHFNAGDDGTNSQYDTGSANPGPPVVVFAPMDSAFTTDDGTWSEGIHKDTKQQYGTIQFEDTGLQITVTARAYAVSGASESLAFTLSKVFPG